MNNLSFAVRKIRHYFLSMHRWIAIILFPAMIIMILTGAVLSLKPVLSDFSTRSAPELRQSFSIGHLVDFLEKTDPSHSASLMNLSADGRTLSLGGRGQNIVSGNFDLETGKSVPMAFSEKVFSAAKNIHVKLFTGMRSASHYVSWAMLAVLVIGPFLVWPRIRNNILGWHFGLGLILLPVFIFVPLSGIFLDTALFSSKGSTEEYTSSDKIVPVSIPEAIMFAIPHTDIQNIMSVRKTQDAVTLSVATKEGIKQYHVFKDALVAADGAGLIKQLHMGIWAGKWSGLLNLLICLALFIVTSTGIWLWVRRMRILLQNVKSDHADYLVAFASQTGNAAGLAKATADILRNSGYTVSLAVLSALKAEDFLKARQSFVFISTTGEGEMPFPAEKFTDSLEKGSLTGAAFSIFALGDSRYRKFCEAGYQLRNIFLKAGGEEKQEMALADADPLPIWKRWISRLKNTPEFCNISSDQKQVMNGDIPVTAQLVSRRLLSRPDESVKEIWGIRFTIEEDVDFRPGDLLAVKPQEEDGPVRFYSIGSSSLVTPGIIDLTVTHHIWLDESGKRHNGKVSGWLCHQAQDMQIVPLSIRRNPAFNPPRDHKIPVILIAVGAGIAPFPGFVRERIGHVGSGKTWLLFGNRKKEQDFLYRDTIRYWQQEGALTLLSTAFSKDADDGSHIDRHVVENGEEILRWIYEDKAQIYLCGHRYVLQSVRDALITVMQEHKGMSRNKAAEEVGKWMENGTFHCDVF